MQRQGSSGQGGGARDELLVMVGTVKGAFLLRSDAGRGRFAVSGPHFPGESVFAMAFDDRGGRRRILASTSSMHWGAVVRHSDDLGATWTDPDAGNVRFPAGTGATLNAVWQLQPAGADQPDTVYAGVEPAALFRSDDAGEHFELVTGLWEHPHRPQWQPGGGGLCLHTVLPDPRDPDRLLVAISTGGVYRSDDGGGSWRACNQGIRAVFLPEEQQFPEFGQCVHKMARAAGEPDRLFLQHHFGVYRSDDTAASWADVGAGTGLPSDFGFPLVTHPREADTAWVLPLDSDMVRFSPGGQPRVFRTTDGGSSWQPQGAGLPDRGAYLTVLRDGFTTDRLDPTGLYFGTRTGQVYASADEGVNWRLLTEYLPPVLCVKTAQLA